jgi:hypothetical protein
MSDIHDLERRIAALEERKPTPGPRGPAGDISAALSNVRAIEANIKASTDKAVADVTNTSADALAKIQAAASSVHARLATLEEKLSTNNFLENLVIQILEEYQILNDGDVGSLVKHHIEKAIQSHK